MSNTAAIVIIFFAVVECLIIIVGNFFTIFVFWKHRNRLKRTSFLLINLAVADLLVGFTEPIALGTFYIPRHLDEQSINSRANNAHVFHTTFSFTSIFFLALISLERAYALIWALRHRVASTKGYIYSLAFAWVAGIFVGTFSLLAINDILHSVHFTVIFGCIMVLCLITVCLSYLAIRTRLNSKVPVIDAAQNRQNGQHQNAKLSRTLFVVITASFLFWFPSIVVYCTHYLCFACVSPLVFYLFNIFRLANSLVNPIIYSFKIPVFRETFKRMKLCRQPKQYTVNCTP
ncbi:melanocyte-stimulating hormone receptor-like [Oculina patagonica]